MAHISPKLDRKLWHMASRYARNFEEIDDLWQEARVAVLKANPPGLGSASIDTWMAQAGDWAMRLYLRRERRIASRNECLEIGDEAEERDDLPYKDECIDQMVALLVDGMTTREQVAFRMHLDGWFYPEIGKVLNIKKDTIERALKNARRKMAAGFEPSVLKMHPYIYRKPRNVWDHSRKADVS